MQLSINLPETPLTVTPEEFAAIAAENPDLRLERRATGELIVNPPTGWETSARNLHLARYVAVWAEGYGGMGFDSSGGCTLLGGETASPDAAWASDECLARARALPPVPGKFFPLCPDFVVQLRSPTDRLPPLQAKMERYIASGARLGWLLDPKRQQVEIYRRDREVDVLDRPERLSGEEILPGFVLPLARILY